LRLDLSQYRELEAFAQFGSDLDEATQRRLNRGERIVEVLKQPQYSPMELEDQVLIIYTVLKGHLDDIPVDNIERFEREFLSYIHSNYQGVPEAVKNKGELDEEIENKLLAIIKEFKDRFTVKKQSLFEDEKTSVEGEETGIEDEEFGVDDEKQNG